MFKLMGKKIFSILSSKGFLILTYVEELYIEDYKYYFIQL